MQKFKVVTIAGVIAIKYADTFIYVMHALKGILNLDLVLVNIYRLCFSEP